MFAHFINEGTMFHLEAECKQGASDMIEIFENVWTNWAGYPQEVYVDPRSELTSDAWAVKMQEAVIKVHMSAGDSHWQLRRAEIHGRTVKDMLSRMDIEKGIESSVEFRDALRQVFQAKTALSRVNGYTPQQAVLGIACRFPGSILSDGELSVHELADSGSREGQRFLQALQLRDFIQADNSSSFRRALLRRTRPDRQDWEAGD